MGRREIRDRVLELADVVGLNPEHINRFPYQLSGSQNQKFVLARIQAVNPEFVVADEPTASGYRSSGSDSPIDDRS